MTATAVAVRRLMPGYRLLPPPVSDEPVLLPGELLSTEGPVEPAPVWDDDPLAA